MKYFIIILEIILLCFTCATSAATRDRDREIETPRVIEETPQPRLSITLAAEEPPLPQVEEEEYEAAKFIWNYLKDLEYSDIICAGILGNIMVEVGGNTLDLEPFARDDDYYGMCQWKGEYYPDVSGATLEEQCDYLRDTIEYEIRVFSRYYSYEAFLAIENVREAALVFANSYERCSKKTYELRQDCAEVAYEYFVGE